MSARAIVFAAALAACAGGDLAMPARQGLDNAAAIDHRAAGARYGALAAAGAPGLVVAVVDRGQTSALLLAERSGAGDTWVSADNVSLLLRDGIIVATRGLGADLMSAEADGTVALLRGLRGGTAERFLGHLDGEERVVMRAWVCEVSDAGPRRLDLGARQVATRLMQEGCHGPAQSFRNLHWVDPATHTIRQSRQWVGPGIGAISFREIAR